MKCSFCNHEIPKGTGMTYVKKDGKIFYFCCSKCEKNQITLDRKPRETKWVTKKQNPKGKKQE